MDADMSQTFSFDVRFAKRFVHILAVMRNGRTLSVISYLLFVTVLYETAAYNIGMITGSYYKALGNKDSHEFWTQTIKAVVLIVIIAMLKSTKEYISSTVYIEWRRSLTARLLVHYFRDRRYYDLNVSSERRKDNLDQRLTQDVDLFCKQLSLIIADLIVWPFLIAFYTYKTWVVIGYIGPLGCLIFFLCSTAINKGLISLVLHFVYLQQRAEGDYRFQHTRVRNEAESIAIQRGAAFELHKTRHLFHRLLAIQERLILRELGLKSSVYMFDYLGSIVSFIILSVPVFGGKYDNLFAADLSQLISQSTFMIMYLINCFTRLIDTATTFTAVGGTTHRIGEALEWLNVGGGGDRTLKPADSDDDFRHSTQLSHVNILEDSGDHFRPLSRSSDSKMYCQFTNVTIKVPDSDRVLISRLSFSANSQTRLLIAGESGTAKTSILRVLRGVWRETSGSVERYVPFDEPKMVLFLSQKPLLTTGSLLEQISYPLIPRLNGRQLDDHQVEQIKHYIDLLDLNSLLDRVGHELTRPVDWNWSVCLSPGEQQRLCFVRLFYHRPVLAVLDESTSAVSLAMERRVYEELQKLDIAYVSCGHRQSLEEYHRQVLRVTESQNMLDAAVNEYTIDEIMR
ncbi:unnamed protein product [Medioppia subpectinata]|uniref:ATP-binding cassette sub-family D member 4 n=1 Tax=Medioppia subpectinata TaxID=1979941 RepID=A0A7R9KW02_9ACAR|nr:unnamed protein product [Medioppia subpectinata]CAG2110509.1 unnamed protein product [Medioppia subpectinata]